MEREMKDSGVEWIGKIPNDWGKIRFKYLHNGMNTGEGIDKEFWSSDEADTVFYTAGMEPIRTNYKDFPIWKYTKNNDLLLARNGTPYVYLPSPFACYTDHIIRADMKEGINRKFVRYSLQQSISSVVIDSVSLATWSASLWNEQTIAWPSAEEQIRIVSFLDLECGRIDSVIEQTRASIEEYKKLKQAVITQVVTKSIRPNRPMKDSGVEWIGEIPSEWKTVSIGRLFSISAGGDAKPEFYSDVQDEEHPYPVYTNSMSKNQVYAYTSKPIFEKGTVTVTGRGAIGTAFYRETPYDAIIRLLSLRPKLDLDGRFYAYWISNVIHFFTDSAAVGQLSAIQMASYKTIYCQKEEQSVIADYLDAECSKIDILISKKELLLSEIELYKKSLIYEYVTGKKEVPA